MKTVLTLLLLGVLFLDPAEGRSPEREIVPFSVVRDAGFGTNVHVVGNHPDLGNWNPVDAVKLRWTDGNVWVGQAAVQKGTALEYKFITRSGASNRYCDAGNVAWDPGANRTTNIVAAPAAPYSGKALYYYSSWPNVTVIYRHGGGNDFLAAPMTNLGPGRHSGEFLHHATGIGEEGEWLQFVMTDGNGNYDKSPYPTGVGADGNDYLTRFDALLLQDGGIYNYWPAASVSAPRKETRWVDSNYYPPILGRQINIVLPRGYDSHPWKRYPVMYFQDGQNITNGANVFGNGSWEADLTAHREASGGRMREVILVGVYNIPDQRRADYNPPGDTYVNEQPGRADKYLDFLVHNVRPTIDGNYRTLTDPRNTLIGGSSMGGICSLYAATDTNVFGGALAMSPAVSRAPNYRNAMPFKPRRPVKIYLDTGTNEGQVGTQPDGYYWDDPWAAYDHLLTVGYAPNLDLMMRIGCGHFHNEAAWRARLPAALRFLLDARDEPNRIAQAEWPPQLTWISESSMLQFPTQQHYRYVVEESAGAFAPWSPASPSLLETNPWAVRSLVITSEVSSSKWLRVRSEPGN